MVCPLGDKEVHAVQQGISTSQLDLTLRQLVSELYATLRASNT